MILFESGRRLKFWDYVVTHNQMLLRSPRSPTESTNIDLVFWHVQFVQLPTLMNGFRLETASVEEVDRLNAIHVRHALPDFCYAISSSEQRYLVVAGGFKVLENELDIFVTALHFFSNEPNRDLGNVLAHS